jgi:hypothetical protein
VGTRYCPPAHLPKSISLHRSLQNGRYGLPVYSVSLLQVGHFMRAQLLSCRSAAAAGGVNELGPEGRQSVAQAARPGISARTGRQPHRGVRDIS